MTSGISHDKTYVGGRVYAGRNNTSKPAVFWPREGWLVFPSRVCSVRPFASIATTPNGCFDLLLLSHVELLSHLSRPDDGGIHDLSDTGRTIALPAPPSFFVFLWHFFIFRQMRMPFESDGARALNRDIFETMYFAAMTASCELAEKEGPYETFKGSPVSEGIFQFDMWGEVRHAWAST